MARQFAISDIHGCAKTFRKLVLEVIELSRADTLYLLGDYVNKGPDSKGVIDFIFQLRESGYNLKCLRGNHEQDLIDGLKYSWVEIDFLNRGGRETLQSFGVNNIHQIPEKYLSFISSLPFFFETDKYLLIHAGLNFDLEDPYKDEYSMLNIRDMEIDLKKTGNKKIIHGHVPNSYLDIENALTFHDNHISIDGGCVYTHILNTNHLVAIEIQSGKLYIQKNIDS
ncbi:MAG: serine/threonine protein phosphatase [Cyclobacteriaceae bacterium]|nr:serine/threonine protein phosphatase [Cyclobacteriaceae bacterium]